MQFRGHAVREEKLRLRARIHAMLEGAARADDLGFACGQRAQRVDAIAAEVHQRAAAALRHGPSQLARPIGDRHVEDGLGLDQPPQLARRHDLDPTPHQPVKAIMKRLDQRLLRFGGRRNHGARLGGVHRERLFAQHGLAGFRRRDGP